jgi:UDP-glucose 4-epimerase
MKILVTGGAGYIGAQTASALLDAGHEVVIADNLSTGDARNIPPAAMFEQGGLEDIEYLNRIFKTYNFVAVVHVAGATLVTESVTNPLKYYFVNTEITRRILETCVRHNVRNFIFSSTAAVYGNNPLRLMKEEYPPAPETPYGASKLMAEQIIKDCASAYDMNFVILRYFNVAGADPDLRAGPYADGATHLIKVVCETATGRRPSMAVYGTDYDTADGSCIRDFIHVHDIAAAHVSALDYMRAGKGRCIFNCGYGSGYSVLETIKAAERITGRKLNVRFEPRRPGDIVALTADSTLLQRETGWTPRYNSLDSIISSGLAWEEKLKSL